MYDQPYRVLLQWSHTLEDTYSVFLQWARTLKGSYSGQLQWTSRLIVHSYSSVTPWGGFLVTPFSVPRPFSTPSPDSRGGSNALGPTAQGSPLFFRSPLATPPLAPYGTPPPFHLRRTQIHLCGLGPPPSIFFLVFPHTQPTLRMLHFTYPRIERLNRLSPLTRSLPYDYLPLQNAHRTSVSLWLVYSSHLAYPMSAYPVKYLKSTSFFTLPHLTTSTPSLPYDDLPYEILLKYIPRYDCLSNHTYPTRQLTLWFCSPNIPCWNWSHD